MKVNIDGVEYAPLSDYQIVVVNGEKYVAPKDREPAAPADIVVPEYVIDRDGDVWVRDDDLIPAEDASAGGPLYKIVTGSTSGSATYGSSLTYIRGHYGPCRVER